MRAAALLAVIAAPSAFAASQVWTNAPVSANWANTNNWIARALPGVINATGNTVNNDIATFTNPIAGGFGGVSSPIITDDATVAGPSGPRPRQIGGLTFDTANCGAYVFNNLSAFNLTDTNFIFSGTLIVSHNNTIRMNPAVTNSQTILVPLRVQLPSSTAGIYNFVNDSTNPAANLIVSSITHNGAASRATTFNLSGTNTGNNIVTNLSEGVGNATGGFTKSGTGTWVIAGTGLFPAASPLNINQGVLKVWATDAFGLASTATVTNSTLISDGVTLNQTVLNLRNGGNLQGKGTVSINGVNVGNQAGNNCTLSTTAASDVLTVGTLLVAGSIISGGAADTVLNTTGAGSLIFAQANTYIGKWSFNAKTNQINVASALGTGANANVGAGAILDFTLQGAVTFAPTTTGFGGSGTGTAVGTTAATVVGVAGAILDLSTKNINLTFTPTAFSGDLTHPSLVMAQGTLAIGGNTFFINNAGGTALGFGTYRIMQSSTPVTSGGGYAALISGSGAVGGSSVSVVVSGGNVDLVVAAYVPKNLVWSGTAASWDIASTTDWLNGVTASVFNNSDNVTFNSVGIANPSVSLAGTLAPASVTVSNNTPNDYTFTGIGQIAGTTALTKSGTGNLVLSTVNTYAGGTVVSNGTVRVGVGNAISAVGSGDVAVYGSGVIDLNGFNNGINALLGNGSVDNNAVGSSVLTVGNNDRSGTFSGLVKNTSGSLGITKLGTGQISLAGANTHAGPTIINAGTLEAQNPNALGSGTVAVNGGNLRTTTNLNVNSLTGANGTTVANSAGAGTTIITHTGAGNTTSVISDGASGTVGIYIPSGTLQLNANNTYSGGTIVASGATLAIGVINPGGSGNAGTGGITASNNAVIQLPTNVSTSSQVPNNITNVDANGTVYFPSTGQANSYNGQFVGGANNTNIFSGPMSIGGTLSFANFGGTAIISNGASVRFFTGANVDSGGDNTTFIVEGGLFNRDARTTHIGALLGVNGNISNPSVSAPATYLIGGKNLTTTYSGRISGTNNIVKSGSGGLTLNGLTYWTNTVTLPDTSVVSYTLFSNAVNYAGTTTVSNGTLTITAPNNLTNSPNITLAGGTLNASGIGYYTNQTTPDISAINQPTNTVVVTSGILQILAGQSLNGQGNITGSVTTDATSAMNVGNPVGTLAISGSIALNGTVNMQLSRTNTPNNSDRLTAASFSGAGATLNVTDFGPALYTGTTFQLFSGAVSAFTTVNLPATSLDTLTPYTWTNKIAINGTIVLLSGASPVDPNPTNITSAVTGGGTTLTLSWPSSHTGWTLQSQTNSLNTGITATWFNVAGSAATNQVIVPIVPGNPTVFYRLKL